MLALVHPAVGFPQQRGGVGDVARMAVPVPVLVRCSSGSAAGVSSARGESGQAAMAQHLADLGQRGRVAAGLMVAVSRGRPLLLGSWM